MSMVQAKTAYVLLQESEACFRRLFESAQDGILLLDADTGQVTDANQFLLSLLDYTRNEVVGKRLWELGFLKDAMAAKEAYETLQRVGYVRYENLPLETKDGRHVEVEFISNVYLVGSKRVIQCNIRDIGEKKRLERLKDNFLGTIAHEIRVPLTVLKLGIEDLTVSRGGNGSPVEHNIVNALKRGAERLEKLILNLLDLSRLESSKAGISRCAVQVETLAEEVMQGFRRIAKERDLLLQGEYAKDLPPIQADPDLLARVLTNLLDNAFRFAKSTVSVSIRKAGADIQISVANDGPGIKQEHLQILFNKFIQIHRPLEGNGYKGTGLGLAICNEILNLHGGKVWAESSTQGPRFCFTLPLQQT